MTGKPLLHISNEDIKNVVSDAYAPPDYDPTASAPAPQDAFRKGMNRRMGIMGGGLIAVLGLAVATYMTLASFAYDLRPVYASDHTLSEIKMNLPCDRLIELTIEEQVEKDGNLPNLDSIDFLAGQRQDCRMEIGRFLYDAGHPDYQ